MTAEKSTVAEIIAKEIRAIRPLRVFPEIRPEDDLRDDLELDSLSLVSIAMELETELNVELPDCVIAKWRCVGDIEASVQRAGRGETEISDANGV